MVTAPINPVASPTSNITGGSAIDTLRNTGLGGVVTDLAGPGAGTPLIGGAGGGPNRKFPIRAALTTSLMYDDNIFISDQHKVGDYIWRIAPTIAYQSSSPEDGKRNYLQVEFTPTYIKFFQNDYEDSLDYNADLIFMHRWDRLTMTVTQTYETLSGATIQAGNFVDRDVYTTGINFAYQYSDKLSLMASFGQTITSFADPFYTPTNSWTGDFYFLYQVAPKLSLGFGPQIGYQDIKDQPDQLTISPLGRLVYELSGKTQIFLAAGVTYDHIMASDRSIGDRIDPTFQAGISYAPFDATTITLAAYSQIAPSYTLGGDNLTTTGFNLSLSQRFFHRWYVTFGAGYEDDSYYRASPTVEDTNRDDGYYFVRVSMNYAVSSWCNLSAGFSHQAATSNEEGANFGDNQASIQCQVYY